MIEATLNLNSLGENVVYRDGRAKFAQIYILICMKKNTDPLNPDKGVDINSYYYAFNNVRVLSELETTITDQIDKYTPYKPIGVQCGSKLVDGKYIISIVIHLRNYEETIVVVADGEQSDFEVFKKVS